VNSYIRLVLDDVFGNKNYVNEIAREKSNPKNYTSRGYGNNHDCILFYSAAGQHRWNKPYAGRDERAVERDFPLVDPKTKRRYKTAPLHAPGVRRGETGQPWRDLDPPNGNHWRYVHSTLDQLDEQGRIEWSSTGNPRERIYADESEGLFVQDIWLGTKDPKTSYPTAKSEQMLERIISASSNPGDLVADFFVGSGTTAAVAEKLGRKWIATDLGKFAIHTTRKRMIQVQRQLKKEGKDYRAFELLNLGRYERQHYVGVNPNLREEEKRQQLEAKEAAFLELILKAYKAEKVTGYPAFHGKKAGRLVAVGPVNLPVTRLFVEEIIVECRKKNITKVDILGFEFEMGLFPNVLDEARSKGIDISPKYIPAEVFDKRAVEKNQVVFHDVSFIEVTPIVKKNTVAVKLTDFSVFYSQDSIRTAEAALTESKKAGSKIVVEKGQIVKVSKDAKGVLTRERLTEKWTDWIDYWAVDFDYESKREIIRRLAATRSGESDEQWEEVWTGDYIFENEWQSFRTKKDRTLELTSVAKEVPPGPRKIAVKVVDIFGNDTMTIVSVTIGKNR
jgi:DNA modification methylase